MWHGIKILHMERRTNWKETYKTTFREAKHKDKDFILNANREINILSGLQDSTFDKRIDKDLFEDKIFKSIVAEIDNNVVGVILYMFIGLIVEREYIYHKRTLKVNIEVKEYIESC